MRRQRLGLDLRRLNEVVARAVAERHRPPTKDEGARPILPVQAYIDDRGQKAIWSAVTALGDREPDLRNHFVGDRVLADLIVDLVAEQPGYVRVGPSHRKELPVR